MPLDEAGRVPTAYEVAGFADMLSVRFRNMGTGDYVQNAYTGLWHTKTDSRQVESVTRTSYGGLFGSFLNAMDDIRAAVLIADASVLSIQGALALLSDPLTVARALPDAFRFVRDPAAYSEWLGQHPRAVEALIRHNNVNFFEVSAEFGVRGWERLPKAGRWLRNANQALWRAVRTFEVAMFEHFVEMSSAWTDGAVSASVVDAEAAAVVRQLIPHLSPAQTGRSQLRAGAERIPLISPSFVMQPAVAMSNAASALAKLLLRDGADVSAASHLTLRERLALRQLTVMGGMVAGLSALSAVLSAQANELSPGDAVMEVLDPTSPRFANLIVGGTGSVSIGGPYRAMFRLLARIPSEGADWPERSLARFARGRLSPGMSLLNDMVQGTDYFGRPIDERLGDGAMQRLMSRMLYAGVGATPIWMQELGEANLEGRSPRDAAVAAVYALGGANRFPRRPREQLDRIARGMGAPDWRSLTPSQQQRVREAWPDLWQSYRDRRSESTQIYYGYRDGRMREQEFSDARLLSGELIPREWVSDYHDRQTRVAAVAAGLWGEDAVPTAAERDRTLRENPFKAYTMTLAMHTQPDGTVDYPAVNRWRNSLTPAQHRGIDENVGVTGTSAARVYRSLQPLRRRYNEIPEFRSFSADEGRAIKEAVARVNSRDPLIRHARGAQRRSLQIRAYSRTSRSSILAIARTHAVRPERVLLGVRASIRGQLKRSEARERYVRANPDYRLFQAGSPLSPPELARLRALVEAQRERTGVP